LLADLQAVVGTQTRRRSSENRKWRDQVHAKDAKLFGVRARMEAPEDVIIAKLVYGSAQDLEDAKAILHAQKNLDRKYLERRANEEKVGKKLDEMYKFFGQQ